MTVLGLIGKPNVGKSTFFKAATLKDVEIADYPFTTIKPNLGVAHVRVKCPKEECNPRRGACLEGTRFVPVEIYDVAGLVPGAHTGKGLGNQFLGDASRARALLMVVDASGKTDKEGNAGKGDPVEDVLFVEEEFDKWMAGIIEKSLRRGVNTEEALTKAFSGLAIGEASIKETLRSINPSNSLEFATSLRKKTKPMLIIANRSDLQGSDEWIKELKKTGHIIIPASSTTEIMLRKANESGFISYLPGSDSFKVLKEGNKQQKDALEFAKQFLKKYGNTGVQQAIETAVFKLLKEIPVFPVENENKWSDASGNILPDCFLIKRGTTTKELAYAIHTDIGDRFVKAVDARTKKALGASHELENGSIVKIHIKR